MAVTLGHHQYGKAETRVVRVFRDTEPHELVDYNVSVTLSGDFAEVHLAGDNANCLTTDAMKNAVNAYAKDAGDAVRQPESFGLALARHFVDDVPQVQRATVTLQAYPWDRLDHAGSPHPHAFARRGGHVRTATVTRENGRSRVVSGVTGLTVLKTTDSEFHSFYQDPYTTLAPTTDRVMATDINARWRHTDLDTGWGASHTAALSAMTSAFAGHHSLALQQTLYEMGKAVLDGQPAVAEIWLSLPNKHHFPVDLDPFGLTNSGEVFHADDRPYGLIEASVHRDDEQAGPWWEPRPGW